MPKGGHVVPPAALAAERRAAVETLRRWVPRLAPLANLPSRPTLARFDEAAWRVEVGGEPIGAVLLRHVVAAVNTARAAHACSAYSASSVQKSVLGALINAVPEARSSAAAFARLEIDTSTGEVRLRAAAAPAGENEWTARAPAALPLRARAAGSSPATGEGLQHARAASDELLSGRSVSVPMPPAGAGRACSGSQSRGQRWTCTPSDAQWAPGRPQYFMI